MTKYEFTLVLRGESELTEDLAEALFAAGCDDGTPGSCHSIVSVDFHREAESLEQAIRSAVKNLSSAGYQIDHVEMAADTVLP